MLLCTMQKHDVAVERPTIITKHQLKCWPSVRQLGNEATGHEALQPTSLCVICLSHDSGFCIVHAPCLMPGEVTMPSDH